MSNRRIASTPIWALIVGHALVWGNFAYAGDTKGRIMLEETPEAYSPSEKPKTGVLHKGRLVKAVRKHVRFMGPDGKEHKSIQLKHERKVDKSNLPAPYDQKLTQVNQFAKVSQTGEHAGIIETVRIVATAPESEGPTLQSSSTFRYYDADGNVLWQKENVSTEFYMSQNGARVGLVEYEARSLEQIRENRDDQRSFAVVYDAAGHELFKYDPGPDKIVSSVVLSANGKYGVADRACFEVDSKKLHIPEYRGSGFALIDDSGRCRIVKYLREHDAQGKQKTETLYEYRF
ncbi:MAG: hypothetical protein WCU88_05185 [Elusimicrobiota bacterium]|jgi:hypothetical protein